VVVAVVLDVVAQLMEQTVVLEVAVVVVHTLQNQEVVVIHPLQVHHKVTMVVIIDQVVLNILQEVVVERLLLVVQVLRVTLVMEVQEHQTIF